MRKRILILGGTRDARKLAARLLADGHQVTSSLAGVTSAPVLPAGDVRVGGFGGARGLAAFLRAEDFEMVIDAAHPFAARISANALAACTETGTRLVRLERPAWQAQAGDRWIGAADAAAAAACLETGARAFVTIGRKDLAAFCQRRDVEIVARMIEAPGIAVPAGWRIVLARPPFSLDEEIALMGRQDVTVLVSKNAGGERPAKLDAARELGLPVVMIARPVKPEVPVFETITDAAIAAAGVG